MSCKVRRKESGLALQRRKHRYPPGSNICEACGHETLHGANYRRAHKLHREQERAIRRLK